MQERLGNLLLLLGLLVCLNQAEIISVHLDKIGFPIIDPFGPTPGERTVIILRETGDNDLDMNAELLKLRTGNELGENELFIFDFDDDSDFVRRAKEEFEGVPPNPAIVIGRQTDNGLEYLYGGPCPRTATDIIKILEDHGG